MAGHSKWANIQHRKGAHDRKRDKLVGKLTRELAVAARLGGVEPAGNVRLRRALARANAAGIPGDDVDRVLAASAGEAGAAGQYEPARYEGYGPGGSAVMVDCLTDDRDRTVAEVRDTLSRHGGSLGAEGSVGYLFNEVGLLVFAPGADEGRVAAAAIGAGAEDVIASPDASIEVLTEPDDLDRVRGVLAGSGLLAAHGEVTFRAHATVELAGAIAEEMVHLIDDLEDLDDVQHVYSNATVPSEILARL